MVIGDNGLKPNKTEPGFSLKYLKPMEKSSN